GPAFSWFFATDRQRHPPMKPTLLIRVVPTLALLVLASTACADRSADDASAAPTATPPAIDQPAVEDVPPATARQGTQTPPADTGGTMPATGAITFEGFGPARFGDDAEAVR